MSQGLPVVPSAVGGLLNTVVEGGTGFLIPPCDVKSFAAEIDKILNNVILRDNFGSLRRKRVAEFFTWKKVMQQIDYQLKQLLPPIRTI